MSVRAAYLLGAIVGSLALLGCDPLAVRSVQIDQTTMIHMTPAVEVDTSALPPEWNVTKHETRGWYHVEQHVEVPPDKRIKVIIVPASQPTDQPGAPE